MNTKLKLLCCGALFAILFAGCSTKLLVPYEEDFKCTATDGGGRCGSVVDNYDAATKILPTLRSEQDALDSAAKQKTEDVKSLYRHMIPYRGYMPPRSDPMFAKVLVMPYTTKDGTYIDYTNIFVKIEDGQWILNNTKGPIRKTYDFGINYKEPEVQKSDGINDSGNANRPIADRYLDEMPEPKNNEKAPIEVKNDVIGDDSVIENFIKERTNAKEK